MSRQAPAGKDRHSPETPVAPSRRLSPAEFQALVAIHHLERPTIRDIREFVATMPPLSASLRRGVSGVSVDAPRGALPSYNNVNVVVLRMLASGVVAMAEPDGDGERRFVPVWDLERAVAHTVALSLRDYLVWKPVIPCAVAAILDQVTRKYSHEEEDLLRRSLESEVADAMTRWRKKRPSDIAAAAAKARRR